MDEILNNEIEEFFSEAYKLVTINFVARDTENPYKFDDEKEIKYKEVKMKIRQGYRVKSDEYTQNQGQFIYSIYDGYMEYDEVLLQTFVDTKSIYIYGALGERFKVANVYDRGYRLKLQLERLK
jgi:hypothetical protein